MEGRAPVRVAKDMASPRFGADNKEIAMYIGGGAVVLILIIVVIVRQFTSHPEKLVVDA